MAFLKTVNLSQFAKTLKADTDERMARLDQAILRALARSIPDLVKASPVDTGLYAQSWKFEPISGGGARIGNMAPYAAIIEAGARPHMAPIGPLLAWAKRVLQDPSQPPHYSSMVWAVAKSVQKKIAEFGQVPKHILENQIPTILKYIKEEYESPTDNP